MFKALQFALRVVPNGLACLGPPCSSWTWVNMATSGRSETDPAGNERFEKVRVANKLPGPSSVQLY